MAHFGCSHRRHQLSLFTACAGMKDCSRLNVRSTELELRRSYSAQQTISTGLCPRSGRPPFVKQQARLAGPTLSELASVSGARRSAIQPSRARRRLADDTKGLPGLEGPPEANRLLAPGHSRALLYFFRNRKILTFQDSVVEKFRIEKGKLNVFNL